MYFGLQLFDVRYIGIGLVTVLIGRTILTQSSTKTPTLFTPGFVVALVGLVIIGVVLNDMQYLKLYPVAISLFFLWQFSRSLNSSHNMIERFALAMGEVPSEALSQYTRKVCLVWCGFFLINACIALITATVTSLSWWTLYNGFISYIIVGLIFLIEFLCRPKSSSTGSDA